MFVLLALGAVSPALGQPAPPPWKETHLDQTAERIRYVRRPAPAAPGALGGPAGAVAAAQGAAWREDLIVWQSGPRFDAHVVVVTRELDEDGDLIQRAFDVRAETIVGFVGAGPLGGAGAPQAAPRALYAEGAVRLVVEAGPTGSALLEAEALFLDLAREQAFVFQATARANPPPELAAGQAFGSLTPVVRARWIRLHGPHLVVAEDASVTGCDHGVPHFALTARRVELRRDLGGERPPRLLAGFLSGQARGDTGSDALQREVDRPRDIRLEGVGFELLGRRIPFLPFLEWNTAWPLPSVRVGDSSRLGTFAQVGLRYDLPDLPLGPVGVYELRGESRGEYYELRGTGGEQGLSWTHRDPAGARTGDGFFRAYGIRDRADADRVGTPIRNEGRFWLRGLVQERLPGRVQLDAELSRISDRGFLLEYYRRVAQTEKEQETYAYARWAHDTYAARIIGRWRLNDFQDQVERLPEVRLDWIEAPLVTSPTWGGVYLDLASRAGLLRRRFDDASAASDFSAGRGDVAVRLGYKTSLGPLQLRGWGGARETVWSERAASERSIDRFAAEAGWKLGTTLWRRFETPLGVLRHEVFPEVGTVHRYSVTRDPSELLLFDPEVELLHPTDHLFLRLRTRLLRDDERGVRDKLVDFALEARYFLRDRGVDRGRSWSLLRYDLRLYPTRWIALRVRADHDVNRGELVALDASATARLLPVLELTCAYRERHAVALATRAVSWGVAWRLTPAWSVAVEQQYDIESEEFLYHRGRVVRNFHRFALELTVSHDPQQDDTSVSASVALAALWDARDDPFEGDRYGYLYE